MKHFQINKNTIAAFLVALIIITATSCTTTKKYGCPGSIAAQFITK